jgi:hypothetical protein
MQVFRPKEEWGKHLWGYIHTICIIDNDDPNTTRQQTDHVIKCLRGLSDSIICSKCAEHFKISLENFMTSTDICRNMALFEWSVNIHNEINRKLGKPEWSYEAALDKWTKKL